MPSTAASLREWRRRNPEKNRAHVKKWRDANVERVKTKLREFNLKKKYGLTVEEYDQMLADQDGHCAICPVEPTPTKRLAVDHCHKTGKVRSLLCHTCNNHLGIYERRCSDFETYLERHR